MYVKNARSSEIKDSCLSHSVPDGENSKAGATQNSPELTTPSAKM